MAIDGNVKVGLGHASFVLGYGPEGVSGHVGLVVRMLPMSGGVKVDWEVKEFVPEEARKQVEQAVASYLTGYLAAHSIPLYATITQVRCDPVRRNDYERAVWLSMYDALQQMDLPLPLIFAMEEPKDEV